MRRPAHRHRERGRRGSPCSCKQSFLARFDDQTIRGASVRDPTSRLSSWGELDQQTLGQRGALDKSTCGYLVDRIQQAKHDGVGFILLNPAGYGYSSVAMRDALTGVQIPFIEVHLSNIHAREPWRAHTHFTAVAVGTILGLGGRGYDLALDYAIRQLKTR